MKVYFNMINNNLRLNLTPLQFFLLSGKSNFGPEFMNNREIKTGINASTKEKGLEYLK